jgi:hypothetical protein
MTEFDVLWSLRDVISFHELKIQNIAAKGVSIGCARREAATKKKSEFQYPIR